MESSYVRDYVNGTTGDFAIGAISCHWYYWRPKNLEQFWQPMAPMVVEPMAPNGTIGKNIGQ